MKMKLFGTILMFLVLACASSSVWAFDVNDTASAVDKITNAVSNTEIEFDPTGNYSGFTVTAPSSAQNLTLNGNGAKLSGNGINHIFIIDNTVGITINNFIINCNGQNGIRGSNTVNATISDCKIKNGSAGFNLFATSHGITITNNIIKNMLVGNGNGISIVNHDTNANLDNYEPNTITGNKIKNVVFGMFLGANFKGTIHGNKIINASEYGIQFVGRPMNNLANGVVNATITNNKIKSSNIGIAFDTHNFAYLKLDGNYVQGDNKCVELNSSTNFTQLIVINNCFWGGFGYLGELYDEADPNWDNNTFNGTEWP